MSKNVFFSWQSDTHNKNGKNFLIAVLEEVCKEISDTNLEKAQREEIALDRDTLGVVGSPPIAESIFNKIEQAAMFIADITYTGKTKEKKDKQGKVEKPSRLTPNSNVLIEYGYALNKLGHNKILKIMNIAHGDPDIDILPFDLRHMLRPITYNLADDATPETKFQERKTLKKVLYKAISDLLNTLPLPITESKPKFKIRQALDDAARFRLPRQPIGFEDGIPQFSKQKPREVFLNSGPAMWLRLMPCNPQDHKFSPRKLSDISRLHGSELRTLYFYNATYNPVKAFDGWGIYKGGNFVGNPGIIQSEALVFAFTDGDIWSIDTAELLSDPQIIPFIEPVFKERLQEYTTYLKALGVRPPYEFAAGIIGVKGRFLDFPSRPGTTSYRGPLCLIDQINFDAVINENNSASETLKPFFEKIFESCDAERPEHL